MQILILGNNTNLLECKQKFGESHVYSVAQSQVEATKLLEQTDLVLDFLSDGTGLYRSFEGVVFISTSTKPLSDLVKPNSSKARFFGFCGVPTFLDRDLFEVSLMDENHRPALQATCDLLNLRFAVVADQVALVTPRIICMIINEAYFTIEEGTATREDIDLAMKLGTNYPFGPFEWTAKIGVQNVVMILDAAYLASGDKRYEVCSLLRSESLLA